MQLIEIDKARYRKHLNIVIIGFISSLLILSLGFGTLLNSVFSNVDELNALAKTASEVAGTSFEPETNFKYNLLGVILALLANAAILHALKSSAFFKEVYYVWQIKQLQNLIYRKISAIKLAASKGEESALLILSFYYQSQLQVYQLDDNTITLDMTVNELQSVNDSIAEHGLDLNTKQFEKSLLSKY
ncbi:DUF3087 family protein [Colwellia sp. E2M01]|uniref:DUF3087 family protein n=1 Tax=Colwellia sp. E2M01 TaxID=2841561 RepID=UPI001C09F4A2|nr:DUF3087 family protein [Colwellia sp. E2M01]MBU2870514.1 DUF3087 domain-containing protein [Colwellia sp. E2M01]